MIDPATASSIGELLVQWLPLATATSPVVSAVVARSIDEATAVAVAETAMGVPKGLSAIRQRLLAYAQNPKKPPENHDLQRSVYISFLCATEVIYETRLIQLGKTIEQSWLTGLKRELLGKLPDSSPISLDLSPSETQNLGHQLTELREELAICETLSADDMQDRVPFDIDIEVLRHLVDLQLTGDKLLETTLNHSKWYKHCSELLKSIGRENLWPFMARFFAEEIKSKDRVSSILLAQMLADTGITLEEVKTGLSEVTDEIGRLRSQVEKQATSRKMVNYAQELAHSGKVSEAIKEMERALVAARDEDDEEEEAEILLGLALLSSGRRRGGDGQHYFHEAERLVDKLKAASAKVIYFRAKASALQGNRNVVEAEGAYREALRICTEEADDEKGNLATQGCIVRSSFVHFLCNQKRYAEAQPFLEHCEDYARKHPDDEGAELFQAALGAGIHFSLERGDGDGAKTRVADLESAGTTASLAIRIGGDLINVANQASHRGMHEVAMSAAQAAIRLGRRGASESPEFLPGAIYTEAVVLLNAGNHDGALEKAEALLDVCKGAESVPIKQAAHQLIAEVRRTSGDSQSAVEQARLALLAASGEPEDVAFTKSALARALNDNGQTEEALKEAKAAWALLEPMNVPEKAALDVLSQITNYASQLGENGDVSKALRRIESLPSKGEDLKEEKERSAARAKANKQIRERILEIGSLPQYKSKSDGESIHQSLQEANALAVRPLLQLWDEGPKCLGGAYDFWGRGNFARLLHNTRCFPNSFNITVEVRTLDDVKRAVRLWGLYADFLMLLWKGECENGLALVPFPEDFESPGGWGYMVAAGSQMRVEGSSKKWYPAMAHVSAVPDDVVTFLATEARPFIESGRLIVVPAPAAGCINPGHGPFEQLLAEAANAIPSLRWKGFQGVPIGLVPHSPDAPLKLLAELAEGEISRLRKLRILLLRRSRQLRPDMAIEAEARMLTLEIEDALCDLTDRTRSFARKNDLESSEEPLSGATAPFKDDGKPLSALTPESPFAALFIVKSSGYGWRVDSGQIAVPPKRFEPQSGDVIGTWLAPPTPGWAIPAISK